MNFELFLDNNDIFISNHKILELEYMIPKYWHRKIILIIVEQME